MNYYDSISKGYDELYGSEQLEKFEEIRKEIQGRVLDVGCGTGLITKLIPNSVGLDSSSGMLSKFEGIKVLADAQKLPFKNKSFDTVISLTVLQDLKNPLKALNEMIRVGKKVVFSIQKRNWSKERIEKLIDNSKIEGKLWAGKKDWFFSGYPKA